MRQKTINFKRGFRYLGWIIVRKRRNGKKIGCHLEMEVDGVHVKSSVSPSELKRLGEVCIQIAEEIKEGKVDIKREKKIFAPVRRYELIDLGE